MRKKQPFGGLRVSPKFDRRLSLYIDALHQQIAEAKEKGYEKRVAGLRKRLAIAERRIP